VPLVLTPHVSRAIQTVRKSRAHGGECAWRWGGLAIGVVAQQAIVPSVLTPHAWLWCTTHSPPTLAEVNVPPRGGLAVVVVTPAGNGAVGPHAARDLVSRADGGERAHTTRGVVAVGRRAVRRADHDIDGRRTVHAGVQRPPWRGVWDRGFFAASVRCHRWRGVPDGSICYPWRGVRDDTGSICCPWRGVRDGPVGGRICARGVPDRRCPNRALVLGPSRAGKRGQAARTDRGGSQDCKTEQSRLRCPCEQGIRSRRQMRHANRFCTMYAQPSKSTKRLWPARRRSPEKHAGLTLRRHPDEAAILCRRVRAKVSTPSGWTSPDTIQRTTRRSAGFEPRHQSARPSQPRA